jgi:hypothetical protein
MATKQYTKGLQKLFTRVYGPTLPDGSALPVGVTEGDSLPASMYVDLLEDDLCFALVNVNEPDGEDGGAYEVDHHADEYLSDVVVGSAGRPVWISELEPSFITKHSDPLSLKKLEVVAAIGGVGSEVKFDCDDVTLVAVPDLAPKSEAIVLYKRVLLDPLPEPGDENDPANIDLEASPLVAYFDGASVALDPNGSDVEVVISGNGLMRWGIGA